MDKENNVDLYNTHPFFLKKMKISGKCIKPGGIIILNEVTQSQKEKHDTQLVIYEY